MQKKLAFPVSNFVVENEENNEEFAIATVDFLSTAPNTHKFPITEEILRKDAKTVINKWLVGKYDIFTNDMNEHESDQNIFGVFPPQEIEFYRKNGYLVARAKAVVSKIYANEVYNLFKKNNFRNVSVEMMVYKDKKTKSITGFHIFGVTVLGKRFEGSCPQANMTITKFSADEAIKYYHDYEQITGDNLLALVKSKYNFNESEGEEIHMANTNKTEPTKNEENMSANGVKCADNVKKQEEMAKNCTMSNNENNVKTKEENAKLSSDANVDPVAQEKALEEEAARNAKISELTAKLSEQEALIESQKAELCELRKELATFKEKERTVEVNQVLASVKKFMSADQYKTIQEEGMKCEFSALNDWKLKAKSMAFDATMVEQSEKFSSTQSNDSLWSYGEPQEQKQYSGLWD